MFVYAPEWLGFVLAGCVIIWLLSVYTQRRFVAKHAIDSPGFLFIGSSVQEIIFRGGVFWIFSTANLPVGLAVAVSGISYYVMHYAFFFFYKKDREFMFTHGSFHILLVAASAGFPIMYALYPNLLWACIAHIALNAVVFGYRYV
ncbi:MAG TPA: CPBP family glutamic-type intramembrane protease [Candidatus Paceibacterota bacterium]|jgi:hypothetical protein|nr:CPBP family glutamic-type intramembrane protease [Candidatus Paceibacterota bacterium]